MIRNTIHIVGWMAPALAVTMLLAPLSGQAEVENSNEITQLRRELQVVRAEAETKNAMIARMQERLDALEQRMRTETQRQAEAILAISTQGLRTESTAQATGRQWGGQVFVKGGFIRMDSPRRNSMLTIQDDRSDREGWQVGAGLDLPVMKIVGNPLLAEIMVEYGETQKTTGAAPPISEGRGLENMLTLVIAPKYRIDTLGTRWPALASIRPWIIPAGLTFDSFSTVVFENLHNHTDL